MASKEQQTADAGTQERKSKSGNAVDEDRSMTSTPRRNDEKQRQDERGLQRSRTRQEQKSGPPGGFDSTPIPSPPPDTIGYTVKFTFHRADDLAIGDAHVMSSDPYCLSQLDTGLQTRHRTDPKLRHRTPTIRKSINPTWNEEWIVANVPSTGFTLKTRVYDEDPADHDDVLGKVHVNVPALTDDWPGIHSQKYRLLLRNSSKRALGIRAVARCLQMVKKFRGDIYISIELLGRTESDGQNGRAYTVGPCQWIRHYSPLLGRLTNVADPGEADEKSDPAPMKEGSKSEQKKIKHYDFQANEMQLKGPVPPELYHRYVEFKPWVASMFNTTGLRGFILSKALHHQHVRVYNFDRTTERAHFPQGPCKSMTQIFLDLVHYDQGGRIFTYVLTLDAQWRFTETGKEFGIDMLSKHTMHSDVSIYIAFSGEFFIRRLKYRDRPPPPDPVEGDSQQSSPDHEANLMEEFSEAEPTKDPARYQLVIDNDSGTYRPNAGMLPILARFLADNLPGLHIMTLDCNGDADKMAQMKGHQRERKKREGDNIVYAQGDDSSISSSEDDRLNEIESGLDGEGKSAGQKQSHFKEAANQYKMHQKDLKTSGKGEMAKIQRVYKGKERSEEHSAL